MVILFTAINKEVLVYQTVCSVLSIYRICGDHSLPRIMVITNLKNLFSQVINKVNHAYLLQMQIDYVDQNTVDDWLGDQQYCFRLKLKSIEHYFHVCHEDLLFFDGDTYVLKDFLFYEELLSHRRVIMFQKIRPVQAFTSELYKYYEGFRRQKQTDNIVFQAEVGEYLLTSDLFHYNSGVIGLPYEYANYLSEVLSISDALYKKTKAVNSEEYAFSYFFQQIIRKPDIYSACREIAHYVKHKESLYILSYVLKTNLEVLYQSLWKYIEPFGLEPSDFLDLCLSYEDVYFISIIFQMKKEHLRITLENLYLYILHFGFTVPDREALYQFYFRIKKISAGKKLCED